MLLYTIDIVRHHRLSPSCASLSRADLHTDVWTDQRPALALSYGNIIPHSMLAGAVWRFDMVVSEEGLAA
jgi:hypothetical protein